MATSLVSTGVQFPDATIQTTAASAGGKGTNVQTFNASGTWTKPSGYNANSRVLIQCWGGGGSGGSGLTAGGGAGGGYNETWVTLSTLGATVTVTIGAGGTSVAATTNGNIGGTTSFGTTIYAYGGGGGYAASGTTSPARGGGGGGWLSAGTVGSNTVTSGVQGGAPGAPTIVGLYQRASDGAVLTYTTGFSTAHGSPSGAVGDGFGGIIYTYVASNWHGGGGGTKIYQNAACCAVYSAANVGCPSVWGGGGGGAYGSGGTPSTSSGGTSSFGGAGGTGSTTNGTAGTQPAGGGGGGQNNSGAGAAGRVIVTVFDGT